MSTLIICEKPSQARNLKAALGSRHGEILPALGHLIRLKDPGETREEWNKWSAELLHPGRPFEKVPIAGSAVRERLRAIQAAMKKARRVIIATDCDREGHLIGRELVDFCGFRGEVLRAMFNKEDPRSLREAFERIRPASEFDGLYASGRAREQADQICNLSLTRAATVSLQTPGTKGAIGIGRVKTPTLSIVCRRELEIRDFRPQDYFEIVADTRVRKGAFEMRCTRLPAALVKETAAEDEDNDAEATADDAALAGMESLAGRIVHESIAERVCKAAEGWQGPLSCEVRDCRQGPPRLFDLTALQAACSARFGWTGDKTLKVAQVLYSEHQIITYPRAEGRHLGNNQIPEAVPLARSLVSLSDFAPFAGLLAEPVIRKGKNGLFSDAALDGSSHHGIAPNFNTREKFASIVPRLPQDEKRLWDLVARSYLAALAPDFEYRQTTIEAIVPCEIPLKNREGKVASRPFDWSFRASGRVPIRLGWREILGRATENAEDEPDLPEVRNGETGKMENARIDRKETRPPARYTEGTLLKAMKEAWRFVDKPDLRAKLKETEGIGTPATRSSIVKGLFDQGMLARKGKSVVPTEAGLELYLLLQKVAPGLTNPARTAAWETLFQRVEEGKLDFMDAVGQLAEDARRSIQKIVDEGRKGVLISAGKAARPSEKMLAFARKVAERKGIRLPSGAAKDQALCRAFLDEHAPRNANGANGPVLPSDKQLAFAERIASAAGMDIPEAALGDARQLSAWIDDHRSKAIFPPSEKQIAYARKLAEERGVELPEAAAEDAKECSAFIDGLAKDGRKRPASAHGGRKQSRGRSSAARPEL